MNTNLHQNFNFNSFILTDIFYTFLQDGIGLWFPYLRLIPAVVLLLVPTQVCTNITPSSPWIQLATLEHSLYLALVTGTQNISVFSCCVLTYRNELYFLISKGRSTSDVNTICSVFNFLFWKIFRYLWWIKNFSGCLSGWN